MNGREQIEYERRRQTTEEGWSIEHDDEHVEGELYDAGVHYLVHGMSSLVGAIPARPDEPRWPFGAEWWKPQTPIRDLVRAGALLLAEADRLKRITAATGWAVPSLVPVEGVQAIVIAAIVEGIAHTIDGQEAR